MTMRYAIGIGLLLAFTSLACDDGVVIDIVYTYGPVGALGENKLDTIEGTFTHDMILDPPITVDLRLTSEERQAVLAEVRAVKFFRLPSVIVVPEQKDTGCRITGCHLNDLCIKVNSRSHAVRWTNCNCSPSAERDRAERVTALIKKIIYSRDEFKSLPPPRGSYM